MTPRREQLQLPDGYGDPKERLDWESVREKLENASVYWLASTRPDGRPHVVPRDGIWRNDRLYYGGSPKTVHHQNLKQRGAVVAHVGDGQEAIIVEGKATEQVPDRAFAESLARASSEKYPQYGETDPSVYKDGVWVLKPQKVIAWTNLPVDATRFSFDDIEP